MDVDLDVYCILGGEEEESVSYLCTSSHNVN